MRHKIIEGLKDAVRSAKCDHVGAKIKRVPASEGSRAREIQQCPKCGARVTKYAMD